LGASTAVIDARAVDTAIETNSAFASGGLAGHIETHAWRAEVAAVGF